MNFHLLTRVLSDHRPAGVAIQAARPRSSRGFSLVEVMVTLTIAAILVSIGLPAMRTMVQNDRQWTQTSTLVMGLNAARSEARKEDVAVTICPSVDALTCSGASWAQGWVVISTAPVAGMPNPIMAAPALPTGSTLTAASSPAGTAVTGINFLSNGMTSLNGGALTSDAALTMCDSRGAAQGRSIEVTLAGRVNTSAYPGKRVNGTAIAGC